MYPETIKPIKINVNKIYSKVRVGNILPPVLYNFALDYAFL
jgi:hypothetical protein